MKCVTVSRPQTGRITDSASEQFPWSQEKSKAKDILLKDTPVEYTHPVSRRKLWVTGNSVNRERLLITWRPSSSKAVSMLYCLWAKLWVIFSKNIILLFLTSHFSVLEDSITELWLQHSHFAWSWCIHIPYRLGRAVTFYSKFKLLSKCGEKWNIQTEMTCLNKV